MKDFFNGDFEGEVHADDLERVVLSDRVLLLLFNGQLGYRVQFGRQCHFFNLILIYIFLMFSLFVLLFLLFLLPVDQGTELFLLDNALLG